VTFVTHWNYWFSVVLLMLGLFTVMAKRNLVKKMMGLGVFQVAVILFYVTMGKVEGGTAPILLEGAGVHDYTHPLPSVLMLTAIVVGLATTAVGLALAVRIRESYGTVEEDELDEADRLDTERKLAQDAANETPARLAPDVMAAEGEAP